MATPATYTSSYTDTYTQHVQTAGEISNRTRGHAVAKFLRRAVPTLNTEKWGQTYALPTNSTKLAIFRRFEALDATPVEVVEGVTPTAMTLTPFDVSCTLKQYGGLITITDQVMDTNEDPVLNQAVELLGEQAAQVIERMRLGVLLAGTNVEYANGSSRAEVNTPFSLNLQRRVTMKLKKQLGSQITQIVKSSARFNTENIAPSYVALCPVDIEPDLRAISTFIDAKDYGSISMWENEIGSLEGVRYVYSTLLEPWADAGGAAGSMESTSGTSADVFPILYFARDAYGIVPLKGKSSVTPYIVNATATPSNPLALYGHVGWKAMQGCVILNQAWMCRAEVAVTAL